MSPLTVTGGGTSGGANNSDKKAAEHIKAVNDEINKNVLAIKLRASALGKEADTQEILNSYVSGYLKLIGDSNGLITEKNSTALALVGTINELKEAITAQQMLATKTAAWNALAQQSTTILEENRSTVDSLYKSIAQLSGADERKLQRDQALAKGNEALAAGNAELAESFFLIVDALDQLERKTVAQQVLATKTAAWNALAQQSTTILEENRSTVDSLYKSIDQLSGVDERKLQRDQALAKGNEAQAAGNAELAESFFLIVDALDQLERKTVAQQVLATKTAAWNTLAQQSTAILEENRSTVDSLYKSIDQLSGADERKLQRDQALAKGNEALAAGNAELAESFFLIVDALDQLERKTVAQQVLATKTAAWNTLAQQSTAILEANRSTVDSLYKSIDQLSGADERKLQRDQALAKGNEALAAGNAELAESFFLIVDALDQLERKTVAQQVLATKTAAWNTLAQQSTTILEENRSTVDSLYKSIDQLSGADERKLQRDQALAKGNEALAAGNAELAESFFLIVDALDQLERKTVAQQVLATKTAAWNTLAQQSTTILEENRSTVDSLYKSIDQLSGADERKLQRDQALAKGNEALAAGNAELAESFFLIVDALDQLERKTVAQQILATKTAAWNALAQQSMTILEENRSTVDSLYKSIDQLSGVDERKLQRDQALAKGNEALAAGNAELAESYFLIVDALDQIERKTVAQQVLATKTAAWNALAQQSTAILEENRSTVDSLYKSIDQLSGADERKLQRDQALAKGNEALAAGNAELAESYFLIVDALNVLIKKTNEFDSKKFFEELGDQALASAESVIASGLNDAFSSIGEAMASGESSADAFGAAMKNFFTSVLQQTSMLAINAGLRLLVEGGITMLPAAIGLLALGGVSAIAAGAISASGQVRQVDYDQYIIDPVIEAETDLAKMRINLIEDQLEKERELRDENLKKIEQQFDMEFSVLQDLWERGLISTQEYKNQAATLRSNEAAAREAVEAPVKAKEAMIEQIEDARKQKLSVLSIEGKKLQDELNGMSGWQKFWSGRDEQLKAQLNTIDARIKATNAAQSLPEISAAKYGADFITAGPRLLKVGDNPGGRERVRVEPIGTPNRFGPSQEQIIIQISGPVYGVEDLYLKLEKAGEQLLRGGRIKAGVFG